MNQQDDIELEVYFRDMNALFKTKGWITFVTDLRENVSNINSVENTQDVADLHFRKGQLNIIGAILNLEDTTIRGQEESQYNV